MIQCLNHDEIYFSCQIKTVYKMPSHTDTFLCVRSYVDPNRYLKNLTQRRFSAKLTFTMDRMFWPIANIRSASRSNLVRHSPCKTTFKYIYKKIQHENVLLQFYYKSNDIKWKKLSFEGSRDDECENKISDINFGKSFQWLINQ